MVSFGRSGSDVGQEIRISQLRLELNTRLKVRYLFLPLLPISDSVISPFHPSIHPPTSFLSLDGYINLNFIGREQLRRRVEFMYPVSFLSFIPSGPGFLLIGSFLFEILLGWWDDPFVFSFVSLLLASLCGFSCSFIFVFVLSIFLGFSLAYFLSACVVLVLSRFGGSFVVPFVFAFVSVGLLHLEEGKELQW